jgi:hypothetical protein
VLQRLGNHHGDVGYPCGIRPQSEVKVAGRAGAIAPPQFQRSAALQDPSTGLRTVEPNEDALEDDSPPQSAEVDGSHPRLVGEASFECRPERNG